MRKLKRTFSRTFFVLEMIIFMYMYIFGANGMRAVTQLNVANTQLDNDIQILKEEVKSLENEIIAWNNDSFYKEKIARERLHMARKNDVVYYVDQSALT